MKKVLLAFLAVWMGLQGHSQNMIDNGDFENDFDNWSRLTGNNGAMAFYSLEPGMVHDGLQSLRISTRELGKDPWDNQLIHKGFYPQKNEDYKLTFYALSKEGNIEIKAILQNTTYSEQKFTLSTEWKKYEWDFKAQEEYVQLKFFFTQLGTVYLDDISIIGKNYKAVEVRTTDTTSIDMAVKHQKIEGFGSALAFYESWITDHPAKAEMYRLAFQDLGLDWLRIRNDFKYQDNFARASKEFVDQAKQWRGDSIRILMCGWTPPATLKNNNNVNNGTLKKDANGFVYEEYAQYWRDALLAYHKQGIRPDWLSIQNEPDWLTDEWETCKFEPEESEKYPGYNKAFDAVVGKFRDIENRPMLLGSEVLGIGNNQFYSYNNPIKDKPDLYAYAYHLYNGGDPDHPDSYNASLQNIKKDFNNKPNVMTEYEHRKGEWYKTAWLMNNLLTEANVSAYFYWDLIWPNAGLIDIDNPYDKGSWRNSKGYQKSGHYHAFKHFSKFIDAGYTRVEHRSSNIFLRSSAYIAADGKSITLVMVNPTAKDITTTLDLNGKNAPLPGKVHQSVADDFFKDKGSIPGDRKVMLPSKSVTTIVIRL